MIPSTCLLKLRPQAALCRVSGELSVHLPGRAPQAVNESSPAVQSALLCLAGGVRVQELGQAVDDDPVLLARLFAAILLLQDCGAVEYEYAPAQELWVVIEPLLPGFAFHAAPLDARQPCRLSRFAYIRCLDGGLVLESPVSGCRIRMGVMVPALLARFAQPLLPQDAAASGSWGAVLPGQVLELIDLLWKTRFLEQESAAVPETWEFHDLLFHRASRLRPIGSSPVRVSGFRAMVTPPARTVARTAHAEPILLPGPPWESAAAAAEPTFTAVLESRRSLRESGPPFLTRAEIGEFLYRVAHIQTPGTKTSRRCYPAAGGIHELEIYAAAGRCADLEAGLYRYDPETHALVRLDAHAASVRGLLRAAAGAMGESAPPQMLFTVTARFAAMAGKYSGIAYRNILLDAGVLMQTMYLVATAMNLRPCALGGGASGLFARATGLDPLQEDPVAEFALSGARPPG